MKQGLGNQTGDLLPSLVFGSLCFVWGSTWLAIKVGLNTLPPLTFAGVRFIIAWGLLLVYALATKTRFPKDKASWRLMLFLGLVQISIPYALTFWGEQYMTSGLTALLFATLPFFVVVFAHFMVPGESVTTWKLAGMLISFVGVAIIFSGQLLFTPGAFWGGVALVASAGCGGYANVVGKKYSQSIHPVANVVVQSGVGAIVLTMTGLALERSAPMVFDQASILAILYLAVFGSAYGFVSLYWLFTRMEVTKIALFTFITPIVAVLLGWFMLSEALDTSAAVGGSLILIGIVIVNRAPSRH